MEVITIESGAFKELESQLKCMRILFLDSVNELKQLKEEKWMSVQDVMDFTGFSRDWVINRKEGFGFFQDGKDLKFWKPNVIKYMNDRSITPSKKRVGNLRSA